MGIHESQSLLWERMVGLSEPFSHYLMPQLTSAFPQLPKDLKPEQVGPSKGCHEEIQDIFETAWLNEYRQLPVQRL